ncbi:MAG: DUF721 domain-containing protein [Deltaproteobacteria bacterium]|nr:DUF721 domain-containing protein [Deltaproteobacteria bacterium]
MKTEKIGETVLSLLENLGLKDAKKCALIISQWEEIAGEGLINLVKPESFRFGTLHLSVSNHSWAQELQLLKPQFLKKVNGILGKEAVKDIRFKVRGDC